MHSKTQTIRIIPIDDRPCHTDFILESTKRFENVIIQMAPKDALGHFLVQGDLDALDRFILEGIEAVDSLIVSLDGLAYGGLVQGRSVDELHDVDYFKERLAILKTVKDRNPDIKIYAYSVIMRLTLTVTDSNNVALWENIFEYSQLVDKVRTHPELQIKLDHLVASLDPVVLENYRQTRRRNHAINQLALDYLSDGVFEYVTLVQEDTSEYGLHVQEQAALQTKIDENHLENQALIKNGTDEMVALYVSRILSDGANVTLDTTFLDPLFIAHYEDKPAYDNLMKSLQVARVEVLNDESNPVLIVLPNREDTLDLCFEPMNEALCLNQEHLDYYEKYQGRNLALLDIAYANGGDIRVLETLMRSLNDTEIIGYSAWNTSSNAMGTLILDCVIGYHHKTNLDYIKMRLVDDALFQGDVRSKLNAYRKEIGEDLWSPNYSDKTESKLNELLNSAIESSFLTKGLSVHATLPWGRSFEVRMEVKS